jgi:hypothetical protein
MEDLVAVVQIATGQLTDYKWMAQDLVILKQCPETFVPYPQMINPH